MKRKFKILLLLLVIAGICILLFFERKSSVEKYSEKSVPLAEICEELSFGIYQGTDWAAFFAPYAREELTGEMLEQLLLKLGVADYIEKPSVTGQALIDRAEWKRLYEQILDLLDTERFVEKKELLILDIAASEEDTRLVTDQGDYHTRLPEYYFSKWQSYELYCIQEQCIGIGGISGGEHSISNAYLTACTEDQIHFLYGGASYEKKIGTLGNPVETGLCDIVIQDGEICALRVKRDMIEGKLLSYDDATIEIEGYGKISHPKYLPIYQTYGEVTEKKLSDIVLGNMNVTYVTGENQVCAILLDQPADIQNIRVLLLAENGGNYREQVYLKSDADAVVSCGEQTGQIAAGTVISAETYIAAKTAGTLTVTPVNGEGKIFLCDAGGTPMSNGYPGALEVRGNEQGYTVVNDVPFETYLCAVVPSEMPQSYELEALKAQAVCARSYAYIQLLRADLAEYGAHINDSTSYQVYNKTEPQEAAKRAVYETAGKMILYEGKPVEAYYFSTSMGYTDTAKIWNIADETSYGYLQSVCLNTDAAALDLSDEETFRNYISQKTNGYDSDVKYYRWFAAADYREKTGKINEILLARKSVAPANILFFDAQGTQELKEADEKTLASFGALTGITVQERSSAGAILTLALQYENGSAIVKNEYNIRNVLGAGVQKIVYADSSESTSVTMLPSSFCAITPQGDGSVVLSGGGYGHGLGMSQNGANGMAKAGMNYEQILQYFYRDITIGSME